MGNQGKSYVQDVRGCAQILGERLKIKFIWMLCKFCRIELNVFKLCIESVIGKKIRLIFKNWQLFKQVIYGFLFAIINFAELD